MRYTIKLIILFLLLTMCLGNLCGCLQTEPMVQSQTHTVESIGESALVLNFDQSGLSQTALQTIDINENIIGDNSLGCLAAANGQIYYELCQIDPATANYLSCSINKIDISSGSSEAVVLIESSEPFFTNELICVNSSLFWVYRDSQKLSIDYYILSTGERGTLEEYSISTPDPILSGDDRFLTWYIPSENGINLFCYDTQKKEVINLTENAAADSPYTRAYVSDGIIAYLENSQDGRLLVTYDLISHEALYTGLLSEDFILTRLQANDNYTICTEGYSRETPIYLLNKDGLKFETVTLDGEEYSIFSCHLYDNYIIINSNLSKELLLLSLNDGTYTSFETTVNVIQSAISPDGLFYGCNPANNLIFALDLSLLA